ncbi:MAG: MTAP family purine nucleoside phosphorylase [Syntrophomonas sp.]|uniref:MTAP family purine nucleoside phosphorylase n=1 Tax=Syntrophomonas sp. TaxID=2053627 RepID=UPI0026262D6B|nr:MTAP family purine nucleoside phosphorylase [Syntrophomonas sp.]MDD2509778.1 MTAP family purine nucleoside phosphorylase [Syntrophomonas sp.]MDD3880082.1 MTAP family purine nucleoside phosphorylase [Syntrophomonas sp.]MDD4625729.1 MTAP family purine nucleoside phosphorylase [Syntrophomonas sp.]
MEVPCSELAFIGGSSSLSIEVPESLSLDYVQVLEKGLIFSTPYGLSPEFKLINIKGAEEDRRVLSCRMHGWRSGISRADASRQVFWVLRQAGVKRVLAEGGVGAVNHLLKPRDLVIPHDYMDFSMRKDVGLDERYLLIMRKALCGDMREHLVALLEKSWKHRVFDRGIYVNTDGRHFESPSEVAFFKMAGGDIVGQSICPEVYLAREIGACYAGLYLVVNYAEGIVSPWEHEELTDIFFNESYVLARTVFDFFRTLPHNQRCNCADLRKETLLKEVYK